MAASIQINQVGLSAGEPNVAREDGLDTGALVTLLSLAHESSFEFAILWTGQHPTPDTTSVASLQAAGANAMSFTPTAGVYGTWRIELVTDRGTTKEDRTELAFAIKSDPTHLRIPAANERSDPSASLVNRGASYVARSTFNAPDGISGSPFEDGTYVSWWRPLADLIHALNTAGGGGWAVPPGRTGVLDLTPSPFTNPGVFPTPGLADGSALKIALSLGNAELSGMLPPIAQRLGPPQEFADSFFDGVSPITVWLYNYSDTNTLTIRHESGAAGAPTYRFWCTTLADIAVAPFGRVMLSYDYVTAGARWVVYP
jgi:hypothetical protein